MAAISDWLAMGGYAIFIWPAYGIAVGALGGIAAYAWRRHWRSTETLARLQSQAGVGE